jgi:hypothetical protein
VVPSLCAAHVKRYASIKEGGKLKYPKLGLLGIALALASCASTPGRWEVPIPPEPILQSGYSVTPLNEKGWYVREQNLQHLSIGKYGEYKDQTFAIDGLLVRLPAFKTIEELISVVKEPQTTFPNPQRFTMLKYEIAAYPKKGPDCVKSHSVMIDHAAANRSGTPGDMEIEAVFLVCAHPKDKSVGVQVMYSQRHWPGQGDPRFLEKAMAVLDSVEFIDAGHKPSGGRA